MTTTTNEPEGTACRLDDDDFKDIADTLRQEGRDWAGEIGSRGGSLANAREACLKAFADGYDAQAAKIMRTVAMETLLAIDGELL